MQWGLISHKLVEKSLCFQGSWMGLAEQGQGRGVFVQQGRHKFNQGQENIFFSMLKLSIPNGNRHK